MPNFQLYYFWKQTKISIILLDEQNLVISLNAFIAEEFFVHHSEFEKAVVTFCDNWCR